MEGTQTPTKQKKPFDPRVEAYSAFRKPFAVDDGKVIHTSAERAAACCACTACTACGP